MKKFSAWKKDLVRLFPNQVFLIPGNNQLHIFWESGYSPEYAAIKIRSDYYKKLKGPK